MSEKSVESSPATPRLVVLNQNDIAHGNNTPTLHIQQYNPQTAYPSSSVIKGYRFVHNSPNSMTRSRSRMKPAFRVVSQDSNTSTNKSVIIEQTFNKDGNGSVTNDRQYVFQLNVKRPPGRPRKNPVDIPKAKRPQGRPRKYPIEVTGTSAPITPTPSELKKADAFLETDLIETKRGRGRPKKADKIADVIDPEVQLQQQQQQQKEELPEPSELALAAAAAAQQEQPLETLRVSELS